MTCKNFSNQLLRNYTQVLDLIVKQEVKNQALKMKSTLIHTVLTCMFCLVL